MILNYSKPCNLVINEECIRPIVINRIERAKAKRFRKIHVRNAATPIVCASLVNQKATRVKKLKEGFGMGFDYSVTQRNHAFKLLRATEAEANMYDKESTKRALLVGCNYPGTSSQLYGCVNDSQNWKDLLLNHFGFKEENIIILNDEGDAAQTEIVPSVKIITILKKLVADSKPGDIVFFSYSGHGTRMRADADDVEQDGYDEVLAPNLYSVIVDDDMRSVLNHLHPEVKFTMISDSCNSGGILDHEEVIISGKAQFDDNEEKEVHNGHDASARPRINYRHLNFDLMIKCLEEEHGIENAKNFRKALFKLHGEDASNAAKAKCLESLENVNYLGPGKKPDDSKLIDPDKGILITGCQSHEYSHDVRYPDGEHYGLLSRTIFDIVKNNINLNGEFTLSNKDLVYKVREKILEKKYPQNPCLECSESNADSNFILW